MNFKSGQGLQINAKRITTVFEYSESKYCFNSKVDLWTFIIQSLPKVTRVSLYLPLNGAKQNVIRFWVTSYKKSKKCNKVSLMSLLALSPTLGEFSSYTGPLFKRTKTSSRITKSLNYRGTFVWVFSKFWRDCWILLELMKVRNVECSKRSKLKFSKIKLSLFSNRKVYKSNIFLLKILPYRQIMKLDALVS